MIFEDGAAARFRPKAVVPSITECTKSLGHGLDALNVKNIGCVESAEDFHLLPNVVLHLSLVVYLVGHFGRGVLEHKALALFHDYASKCLLLRTACGVCLLLSGPRLWLVRVRRLWILCVEYSSAYRSKHDRQK